MIQPEEIPEKKIHFQFLNSRCSGHHHAEPDAPRHEEI
jgi:hypothetical protein